MGASVRINTIGRECAAPHCLFAVESSTRHGGYTGQIIARAPKAKIMDAPPTEKRTRSDIGRSHRPLSIGRREAAEGSK